MLATPAVGELPELCRICIAQDGRVKANFADNNVLLVSSSGGAFTVCSPDGQRHRQLSDYALSKYSPLLAVVLEFRNMHLDIPCMCQPVLRALRGVFSLGYHLREVFWPSNVQDALNQSLVEEHADGRISISTEDRTAQIVLHAHRQRFAVCFPLLVEAAYSDARFDYVWHTQVFSMQSFPSRWQPAVQIACEVAAFLDGASDGQSLQTAQHGQRDIRSTAHEAVAAYSSMPQPSSSTAQAQTGQLLALPAPEPAWDAQGTEHNDSFSGGLQSASTALYKSDMQSSKKPYAQRTTELPSDAAKASGSSVPLGAAAAGLTQQFAEGGWWFEEGISLLPPEDVIILEWTPHATYNFHASSGEVEAWLHQDESCLLTVRGGRYVMHVKGRCSSGDDTKASQQQEGGQALRLPQQQLYAAHCVPEFVWSSDQSARYALGQVAAHAAKLRQQMASNLSAQQQQYEQDAFASDPGHAAMAMLTPAATDGSSTGSSLQGRRDPPLLSVPSDHLFAAASNEVLEEAIVPGQGAHTAFTDGRVRIIFEDRTILQLSSSHTHCKLFLPDGRSVVVATANPVGVEGYVHAARDFAQWAFRTPAERAAQLRAQARVAAELQANQRMATMCEYGMTGRMPEPLTAAATAGPSCGGVQEAWNQSPNQACSTMGRASSLDYDGAVGSPSKHVPGRSMYGSVLQTINASASTWRDQSMAGPGACQASCQQAGDLYDSAVSSAVFGPGIGVDRRQMIDELLNRNAELLKRL